MATGIADPRRFGAWNGYEGRRRAESAERHEAMVGRMNRPLFGAAAIGPDDRVPDIGRHHPPRGPQGAPRARPRGGPVRTDAGPGPRGGRGEGRRQRRLRAGRRPGAPVPGGRLRRGDQPRRGSPTRWRRSATSAGCCGRRPARRHRPGRLGRHRLGPRRRGRGRRTVPGRLRDHGGHLRTPPSVAGAEAGSDEQADAFAPSTPGHWRRYRAGRVSHGCAPSGSATGCCPAGPPGATDFLSGMGPVRHRFRDPPRTPSPRRAAVRAALTPHEGPGGVREPSSMPLTTAVHG